MGQNNSSKNNSYKSTENKVTLSTGAVQSLTRGLKILQKMSEYDAGISLKELASAVNLPASTTHRLLLTLQQEGFAFQSGDLAHWNIGVSAFMVGSAFYRSRDLLSIVHPIMREVMQLSGETTNLLVLNKLNWKAILIGQVECHELMRMVAPMGSELPVHASAAGKLFLASYPNEKVNKIINQTGLTRITENTLTQLSSLFEQLQWIRTSGYAEDREEHAKGLYCVAAPIFDESKQMMAAISISGPKIRINESRMSELGKLVKRFAEQATSSYSGNSSSTSPSAIT